jgi:hypothetical protein
MLLTLLMSRWVKHLSPLVDWQSIHHLCFEPHSQSLALLQ